MVSVFKYCPYLNLEIYIPTVKHHQTRRKKRYEFYDSDDELYFEEINKDNVSKFLKAYYIQMYGIPPPPFHAPAQLYGQMR
jgi:hypothetical protein